MADDYGNIPFNSINLTYNQEDFNQKKKHYQAYTSTDQIRAKKFF